MNSQICHKCGEPANQHGQFGFRDHAPRDANGDEIIETDEDEITARAAQSYNDGFAAGLKEGARRERRALLRWAKVQETWFGVLDIKDWLASRKRKGGNSAKP